MNGPNEGDLQSLAMDNDVACLDCGSRFYRSELPSGTTFEDKLQVHKEMGCNTIGDPPESA